VRSTNLLIIDDDADILEILRLEFEDEPGYRADITGVVDTALFLAKKNHYDAIISDWRMPVMNGTELVGALRQQGCTAAIIIYSGKEMDADIRETLDAGADYFVSRRGDPDSEFAELKQTLAAIVTHKTAA
jgi:DNA-binding response OmpR family regulator